MNQDTLILNILFPLLIVCVGLIIHQRIIIRRSNRLLQRAVDQLDRTVHEYSILTRQCSQLATSAKNLAVSLASVHVKTQTNDGQDYIYDFIQLIEGAAKELNTQEQPTAA